MSRITDINFGGDFVSSGVTVAPGVGRRLYVHNDSATWGDYPPSVQSNCFTSLNNALADCRANRGDVIYLLRGHVETIDAADKMSNLPAGVTIVGLGTGNQRPILRWTAAAATFLFDQAGTVLRNCRLQMAGDPSSTTALSVAAPITVSAGGCAIQGCDIQVGVDADQLATIGITTTADGDDFVFEDNVVYGAAASEVTTVFRFVGADRLRFRRNKVTAAVATDTDGLLQFQTTASTDVDISDNVLQAHGTGNTVCIQMSASVANTGWLVRNFCRNAVDASTAWIVTSGTGVNVQLQDNYGINNSNERGLAIGTASV